MSNEEPMSGIHDCGADAAAYALGALEPDEAERFKVHLEDCVVCRDELAAFQQVTGALPMAAPQHAVPRRLRRRVLSEVRSDARLREPHAAARTGPRIRPAWAGALAGAVAVAVVVVIAVGSGSSTRVISASVGHAQLRISGGHAELIVDRLPQAASGHIYEVWLERAGGQPQPTTALFGVTHSGTADVGVPGNVHGVSEVMVTQEPAGGSPHPTTDAVIVAHL
ncbi:MAG TPA: anti-sigma factor [Solirubrobacteraceae bacterium]|nr:anti-sigma factor [Solirubrobacteraceae bacterium]